MISLYHLIIQNLKNQGTPSIYQNLQQLGLSPKFIKKAIRNETNAIDKFELRTFSKKEGINIFKLPPSKKTTKQNNWNSTNQNRP